MSDILSDMLRVVRLRGAIFSYVECTDPWVAETPRSREIIAAIMPGVEHLMPFHAVATGTCFASLAGGEAVRLDEGDLALFPQGDHHVMSSAPGLRAKSVDPSAYFAPRPSQLPHSLSVTESGLGARRDNAGPIRNTVVCGFIGCDANPLNPLLASMPKILRMPRVAPDGSSWIGDFIHLMVVESRLKRPGGEAVLERMSEMLFVEVLRRYVDMLPEGTTGWLAGLRDPAVGRALAIMHERPAVPWTVERLGEVAAVSRSVLHERFVQLIGQPPMQYLASWRMQLAAAALRDSDAKVVDIAGDVGYESEAAFSRAFRRAVGESPAAWRRARRAGVPHAVPESAAIEG
jgi:AraC-like DNA-binding protein